MPRRQVRALLFYLAATAQSEPRHRLCYLLWANEPEAAARRRLSRLLTHLRRALPDSGLLTSSGDLVGLDPERTCSDCISFAKLADLKGGTQSLRRAADLYRGPFLAGASLGPCPEFEAWVLEQQGAYEHLYLSVLNALVDRYTNRHEYGLAIDYAKRHLATDELAEDVHRRLIALHAATGNRGAALEQFERCTAILERELSVRPLPETRVVYESALQSLRPSKAQTSRDHLSWTTLPGLNVPLVGREAACRQLNDALAHAQAGRGGVVLISGESGIGKSRLMEAFATDLHDRALILSAAARSAEQPLPYQPVAEALRSIPDLHTLASAVPPIWLAEAARLLPELRDLQSDLSPLPAEPDEARTRLLEALCRLMLGLAGGPRAILLCLDDLHWADRATIDWLICLARRLASEAGPRRPILVLGTYRSEERERVHDLREKLFRMGMLSELRLTGLKPESVLQIVRHLTGPDPGIAALSERLHRATGGNPFFLLETLRVLLETREVGEDLTALREVPLPDTVRHAIEARLQRLDPGARQVLEAGAVLGMSFDFELVRRTAGRGEMETVDGLDQVVARQLLMEHTSGYRFRHALIRQTVEATMGPVRRHLLHRRAARALERIASHTAARIARHYDLGGELEKALQHYRRAAQQAADLFAWQEAEEIQTRMLILMDQFDPHRSDPDYVALRSQILALRAHVRFLQGRLEERDADLATLTSLANASGDQQVRLRAHVHRVRYLNLDAKYEEALKVAHQGLALTDVLDRTEIRSRLLAQIGFAHYFLGEPRHALRALESALGALEEDSSLAMRGRIAHIMGYVYFHLADYSCSLSWQNEAHACHEADGDHNRVAWDGLDIGALHLELGDLDKARRYLTEHLALARRIGARPAEAYGSTLLGVWELYSGDYVGAVERFEEARSMHHELRSEHGMVAAALGAGLAFRHLGELDRSQRSLRRAVRRAREIHHRRLLSQSLIALGMVQMETSCSGAAHSPLVEAVELARDGECWECVTAGLSALARERRRQGDLSAALEWAREAVDVARRLKLSVFERWARMELGLVLLAQGELQEALEQTTRAVDSLPHSHEAWIGTEEVHRAHARVLKSLGRDPRVREQRQLADAAIQAKAACISDPHRRRRYTRWAKRETS